MPKYDQKSTFDIGKSTFDIGKFKRFQFLTKIIAIKIPKDFATSSHFALKCVLSGLIDQLVILRCIS